MVLFFIRIFCYDRIFEDTAEDTGWNWGHPLVEDTRAVPILGKRGPFGAPCAACQSGACTLGLPRQPRLSRLAGDAVPPLRPPAALVNAHAGALERLHTCGCSACREARELLERLHTTAGHFAARCVAARDDVGRAVPRELAST